MDGAPARRILAEKYEVVGVLGEGGTGIVYDAITKEGAPVALKVMHAALADDSQVRRRFQREANILRRLDGDHICPILDFGEVPGDGSGPSLPYLVLPKIAGPSLADVLAQGLIDVDRALDIMLEVLAALTSAHAQGVIHRDLKPANVLLESTRDANGKPAEKVVVVDFGMSKIVTGAGIGTTNLTTHNMVFGTPEYMSPEQARGDELDARCDVYAAGIMLYEMLTGAPPFAGPTPLSVLTAHLTSDLERPSNQPNGQGRVTSALDSVVMHALARDRDQRYPSASTFSAAIVQARAAPNDVLSLFPAPNSVPSRGPDAFAATVPSTGGGLTTPVHGTAPTLIVAERPLLPPAAPTKASAPPSSSASGRTNGARSPDPASTTRTWVLLWIVVGLASIATGVWFALRQ